MRDQHEVTIHYKTPWKVAVFHYSEDGGKTWRDSDEFASRSSPIGPDWIVLHSHVNPSAGLTFVLWNGDRTERNSPWYDCSPEHKRGENYFVHEGGTYVLADGALTRFSAEGRSERDDLGGELPRGTLNEKKGKRLCLFLDIDGTLHGYDWHNYFTEMWQRHLALSGGVLAFNTGRRIDSVHRLIQGQVNFPVPSVAICRVGTEVYWCRDNGTWTWKGSNEIVHEWKHDEEWEKTLGKGHSEWHMGKLFERIEGILYEKDARNWDVKLHMESYWAKFVVSMDVKTENSQPVTDLLKERLKNVYKVKILLSGYGDYRYLDVLHEKAGKLGGMRHVLKKLGCSFSREHAVMAGDSGNDSDALFHDGPELGIIVGNAAEELVDACHEEVDKGDPQRINRLFLAEKSYAKGVLEGLQHFGFL